MDSKIIAAIITACVSLIIGIINLVISLKKQKKDKQILIKQEKFNKELELLKTENQKQILRFQQNLTGIDLQKKDRVNKEKSILKTLQKVKDSMHYFKNILKVNGNSLLNQDIIQLKDTIFSYIDSYNTYYMNMDEYERRIVHEIKNQFHEVITEIEIKQRMKEISESNSEAIITLNNCLYQISSIQDDLIQYYENQ